MLTNMSAMWVINLFTVAPPDGTTGLDVSVQRVVCWFQCLWLLICTLFITIASFLVFSLTPVIALRVILNDSFHIYMA